MMAPRTSGKNTLKISRARENNLKDLTLEIPHDTFVGVTGLSGSGKSSLAFDTIYAEGQRRYIETFSPYTRQFFDKVKRPKVDVIEEVRPAIAIQQRTRVINSRSTVGSMTDINDFLKIIWCNLSTPVCPECGLPLSCWNPASLAALLEKWCDAKIYSTYLIGVYVPNKKEAIDRLRTLGYSRYFDAKNGDLRDLEEAPPPKRIKEVCIVIDRCKRGAFSAKRIKESLEQCFSLGSGRVDVIETRDRSYRPLVRVSHAGAQSHPAINFEHHLFFNTYHCGDGEVRIERPRPSLFSSNHPIGACPECNGFGRTLVIDPAKCVPDPRKSIMQHAIDCWRGKSAEGEFKQLIAFCKENGIAVDKPWRDLKPDQRNVIFNHKSKKFTGVNPWFTYLEGKKYKMHVRVFLARYRGQVICPACNGTRLKRDAIAYRIDGMTIADITEMPLDALLTWFEALEEQMRGRDTFQRDLKEVFTNLIGRLKYLVRLGLPYLTLERQARTLSGGETQRVNLVSALGSNLISAHFVLDEPSVGLHPRDSEALVAALKDLTNRGNSLTVVEHDPDCLLAADTILELGPEAGERGGQVTYFGDRSKWPGQGLKPFRPNSVAPSFEKTLKIRNARSRNLKSLDVDIPLKSFVCLTGVSGSGKSSLLSEVIQPGFLQHKGRLQSDAILEGDVSGFEHVGDLLLVDQSPLAKSPRANIATYTKIWDRVRDLLANTEGAKSRGLSKSAFSFNVNAGRCTNCEGSGFIREDMQFLSDVFIECEVCLGKRFQAPVLEVLFNGKNVHELLTMSVDACREFFHNDLLISSVCSVLSRLGLGHITIGHPLSELSGGEAQRLKLVPHILEGSRGNALFLFDEPTTGLHGRDVERLIELFYFLRDSGHSILCVEHNLRLIAAADWIIDLGPEGGARGGELVKTGTPLEFVKYQRAPKNTPHSLTAHYLKEFIERYGDGHPTLQEPEHVNLPSSKRRSTQKEKSVEILGAREHNLKNIDVHIPLNTLITLTGVSGSGKSTIAKDILYAEGQRRYLDCLSPYARQYIKELKRPDVDDVRNVPPTICVYQHTYQPSALSTVATMSEVYNFLRLLYAKIGIQYCPDHPTESISPLSGDQIAGHIKENYKGSVRILAPIIVQKKGNHRAVFQRALESEIGEVRVDGVLTSPSKFSDEGLAKSKVHSIEFVVAKFNVRNLPVEMICEAVAQSLSAGGGTVIVNDGSGDRVFSSERTCRICQRGFFKPDPEDLSFNSRRGRCPSCDGFGVIRGKICSACGGTRLNEIGRNIQLLSRNIFDLTRSTPSKLLEDLQLLKRDRPVREILDPIMKELEGKLGTLVHLGLDHLELNRDCASLSNGELQRLRLGTAMGSPLCGVTYIFDEPSAGLHPADNKRLLKKLRELKDRGNTVIQIEHEIDNIWNAEHIIDVGPGAGSNGGTIVFQGDVEQAIECRDSATGHALRMPISFSSKREKSPETLSIKDARKNNLKNLDLELPLLRLTTVAGVSGAGKSSLVHGTIVEALTSGPNSKGMYKGSFGTLQASLPIDRFLVVDQQPIGKTSRSTPASYLSVWDEVRKVFAETLEAKSRGWKSGFFSHNTGAGRCAACKGQGEITLEMSFLAEAKVMCESCLGSRFSFEAESVKFRDLSVSDVLRLTFEQARTFFVNHRKIHQMCKVACDLGLGYLTLGQPSSTLSGGESQRLKLVAELNLSRRGHTLYILDEPTTGLHRLDVDLLLKGLQNLVDHGNTVLIIEHDADTIAQSDWVIELGPGPGESGGTPVFQGIPSDLIKAQTLWGESLRERVALHDGLNKETTSNTDKVSKSASSQSATSRLSASLG